MHEDPLGAELPGLMRSHTAAYPVFTGLVRAGGYYAASVGASAHDHAFALQGRVFPDFDVGKLGVHIHMDDLFHVHRL